MSSNSFVENLCWFTLPAEYNYVHLIALTQALGIIFKISLLTWVLKNTTHFKILC